MKTIKDDNLVFCDVDDTLIGWGNPPPDRNDHIDITIKGRKRRYWVLTENVEQLYHHASRGHTIIVWSQGGHAWTEAVAKALNIDHIVALGMCKPKFVIDDLDSSFWMPKSRLAERK